MEPQHRDAGAWRARSSLAAQWQDHPSAPVAPHLRDRLVRLFQIREHLGYSSKYDGLTTKPSPVAKNAPGQVGGYQIVRELGRGVSAKAAGTGPAGTSSLRFRSTRPTNVLSSQKMGAIDALWEGDLAQCLIAALRDAPAHDARRALGRERGGRTLAATIAERAESE